MTGDELLGALIATLERIHRLLPAEKDCGTPLYAHVSAGIQQEAAPTIEAVLPDGRVISPQVG